MAVAGYEYSELSENLERLEQELLSYEKQIQSGKESAGTVHSIFRYAHNLKSALAMVHRHQSSHLIHEIETNFDKIRNGKAAPSGELIRLSFLAIDMIKNYLLADSEDGVKLNELAEVLSDLSQRASVSETRKLSSLRWVWNPREIANLSRLSGLKYRFYLLEKPIRAGISPESFKQLPFFEDISKIGEIIRIYPEIQEILSLNENQKKSEIVVTVIFVSNRDEEEIKRVLFESFYLIENDLVAKTSCGSKELKTILHIVPGESGLTLPEGNYQVTRVAGREGAAQYLRDCDFELTVIDSDDGGEIESLLDEITALEISRERLPGEMTHRMVISGDENPELIWNCFIKLSDSFLPRNFLPLDWKKELKWLFIEESV